MTSPVIRHHAWVRDQAGDAESDLMLLAEEAEQGVSGTFTATIKAITMLIESVQDDLPAVGGFCARSGSSCLVRDERQRRHG